MITKLKQSYGNPLVESSIKNSFKGVQKPSHKFMDLHINAACIKMLVWNNQTKVQGHGLVHNKKWEEAIQFNM
jgi:hypothetical protein